MHYHYYYYLIFFVTFVFLFFLPKFRSLKFYKLFLLLQGIYRLVEFYILVYTVYLQFVKVKLCIYKMNCLFFLFFFPVLRQHRIFLLWNKLSRSNLI